MANIAIEVSSDSEDGDGKVSPHRADVSMIQRWKQVTETKDEGALYLEEGWLSGT